ncbi:MAG: hydrolase [Pirellulaceae bacterium]
MNAPSIEQRLSDSHAWLSSLGPEAEQDLIRLANQNSGSSHLSGLHKMADMLVEWMDFESDGASIKASRVDLPERTLVSDLGTVDSISTGPILRWDARPECARRVLLVIHYDTVFGQDHSFQSCTKIADDKLNGPGVADAKGGIVVLRNAIRAAEHFGLVDPIGWTVLLNPDEEVGSLNSTEYLQSIAGDFDFGLLFEPSLPTGELVAERKGSGNFDIVVRGRSAHAGRHFEEGRNAVALLSQIFVELDALNRELEGCTVNVGQFRGGGAVNVVPALAVGRLNIRVKDDPTVERVSARVEQIVEQANQLDGFEVELYGGMTSPPKTRTPGMSRLMEVIEDTIRRDTGHQVSWRSTGGVCDGNKLAAAGLPNIDTLGPAGGGLHSSDEWVQVSSLTVKAKIITSLLARFANDEYPQLARK